MAKKYTKWTPEMVKFLEDNYWKHTYKELSEMIGIPWKNIAAKKRNLYLKKKTNKVTTGLFVFSREPSIGTPDWSDITEEELLTGYVPPTFDELSKDEKEMYIGYVPPHHNELSENERIIYESNI